MARARIAVLAGVNGAGKSSIAGATIREAGGDYFNPDEVANKIRARNPSLSVTAANGIAWQEGLERLRRAIGGNLAFTIETTLGGNTMTAGLANAARAGAEVRVWFVGLASVELHLARIRSRVEGGGHDIPEVDVRRRYRTSRLNLVRLMPHLMELKVFDNSADADPRTGAAPTPLLVLHVKRGRVLGPKHFGVTPEWAKPIVAAALRAKLGK